MKNAGVAGTRVPATPTLDARRRPLLCCLAIAGVAFAEIGGRHAVLLDARSRLVPGAALPRQRPAG